MLTEIMYKQGGIFRKIVVRYILKKEGVFHSTTLRKIFKDTKGISAGDFSYGWQSDTFDGPAEIGKYVSIAPNVTRLAINHCIIGVSTHPCYFNPIIGWVNKDFRKRELITEYSGRSFPLRPDSSSNRSGMKFQSFR